MEVAEGQVTEGRREPGHRRRRVKSQDGKREGESLGGRARRATVVLVTAGERAWQKNGSVSVADNSRK